MRLRALLVVLLAAGVGSLVAMAGTPAGVLDVEAATGVVSVRGSGALLGRVSMGSVVVVDRSPNDAWRWWLNGKPSERRGSLKGADLSFRILGGDYLVIVHGEGISISARGRGIAYLLGRPGPPGLTGGYTTDLNADCQDSPTTCIPLPTVRTRVPFGAADLTPPKQK